MCQPPISTEFLLVPELRQSALILFFDRVQGASLDITLKLRHLEGYLIVDSGKRKSMAGGGRCALRLG